MAGRPKKTEEQDEQKQARLKELEAIFGFRLLVANDVAERVRVHSQTLIKDIKAGRLKAYQPGRYYLIKESDAWEYVTGKPAPQQPVPSTDPQKPFDQQEFVWLSPDDAMLFLHRGYGPLMEDINAGRLEVFRPGGSKDIRILPENVVKYLESFKVQPEE